MYECEILSESPRIVSIKAFLSEAECAHLIALSAGKLVTSTIMDEKTGESALNPHRTGNLACVDRTDIVLGIERRISEYTKSRDCQGEQIQVIQYQLDQKYDEHHDALDPRYPGLLKGFERGGNRKYTFLMYLSTPLEEGGTRFPKLDITVPAIIGNALFWENLDDKGCGNDLLTHQGLPPKAGEKWIATRWIRERAFDGSEEEEFRKSEKERKVLNTTEGMAELDALLTRRNLRLRVRFFDADGTIGHRIELISE